MTPLGSQFPGNESFPTGNTEGGEWIWHRSSFSPVDDTVKVETIGKDGSITIAVAWLQDWKDAVKYRVVKP